MVRKFDFTTIDVVAITAALLLHAVSLGYGVYLHKRLDNMQVSIAFDHRVVARVTKPKEKFPHCALVEYSSHPQVKKLLCYNVEIK